MNAGAIAQRFQAINWQKHRERIRGLTKENPLWIGFAVLVVILALNWIGIVSGRSDTKVIEKVSNASFKDGRIISDNGSQFYRGREKQLAKMTSELMEKQAAMEAKMKLLDEKLAAQPQPSATQVQGQTPNPQQVNPVGAQAADVRFHDANVSYEVGGVQSPNYGAAPLPIRSARKGPALIAFPVKDESPLDGVALPSGSYVKAKMLTGVDVPEGKTYPVLLVLDYSYVAPNDTRLDLTGCFMIAKAEGDLSTERVQMQASKLSCVSKKGKMFEREVNGFIADHTDGSFAMKGKVNTKQGRVAAMAFMSSVVEGVGKAIQQSQTTNSINPLGGSSSVMTGDAEKYAVAGGAANAASMVAQWYLRQAQSLSPTVSVASGKDVWIVMKDKVDLPKEFFRKQRSENAEPNVYSYLSRAAD